MRGHRTEARQVPRSALPYLTQTEGQEGKLVSTESPSHTGVYIPADVSPRDKTHGLLPSMTPERAKEKEYNSLQMHTLPPPLQQMRDQEKGLLIILIARRLKNAKQDTKASTPSENVQPNTDESYQLVASKAQNSDVLSKLFHETRECKFNTAQKFQQI